MSDVGLIFWILVYIGVTSIGRTISKRKADMHAEEDFASGFDDDGGENVARHAPLHLPSKINLPFAARWQRRFHRLLRSRKLAFYEFDNQPDGDNDRINVSFFGPCRPLTIKITIEGQKPLNVARLWITQNGDQLSIPFGYRRRADANRTYLTLLLSGRLSMGKLSIEMEKSPQAFQYQYRIAFQVIKEAHHESALLRQGFSALNRRERGKGLCTLEAYNELCNRNPHVHYQLAVLYGAQKEYLLAEEHALRALALGFAESGFSLYRSYLEAQQREASVSAIRALQAKVIDWDLPGHLGVVSLQRDVRYTLALHNCHLVKYRELLQIRRRAAGRMLRQLSFDFAADHEWLLYSTLRIVHPDDEIEVVPIEHFMVSDAESKNIFITVENKQKGSWILPDLEIGDVIEWSYDLLCRDLTIDEIPHPFILVSLASDSFPTYSARLEFKVGLRDKISFVTRNITLEPRVQVTDDGRSKSHIFDQQRYILLRNTGFPYENNYLNPVIACTSGGRDWASVAADIMQSIAGREPVQETVPAQLAEVLDAGSDKTSSLANAFYWIRDRIKYGAFRSGSMRIGQARRAEKLIERGIGDCKDKSYLLALVCEKLQIPYNYVSVSVEHGTMVEELPADQFDHVFIRARPAEQWLYLDAASGMSTFGNPPAWCQGLTVLALDEAGTRIPVPEDDPEKNRLVFRECVESMTDGWLDDAVTIDLAGHSARYFDERWKALSLNLSEPHQAAQQVCREFMPSLALAEHERLADTTGSDSCLVTGRGRRGPAVEIGDRRIIQLSWMVSWLPLAHWRLFDISRLFVFLFPLTMRLEVTIGGELHRQLVDVSRIPTLENDICSIREELQTGPAATTLRRTITIKRKFVRGDCLKDLPATFEGLEAALQAVLAFGG